MSIKIEKYALATQTYGTSLIAPMKKYTRPSKGEVIPRSRDAGTILLLGHGVGFFKEIWEPTIEDLFRLDPQAGSQRIREIWSLDWQNHGDGGVLNEDILVHNMNALKLWDYGDAFATLLKSGLLGIVDPVINPIILCGHSAGAVAATIATSFFNPPSRLPISQVILVDPPIWSQGKRGQYRNSKSFKHIEATTPTRKDIWKDFETASEWFKSRVLWDKRVLDVYLTHGLRALPTAHYQEKTSGVTLKTHRLSENIVYTSEEDSGYDALNRLNQICEHIPVHLIYGARNDMFERDVQDTLIDPQQGRVFASVTRIAGAGHLVVQEAPTKLAAVIFGILSRDSWPRMSKL